jgi:hypothetical protein
MRKWIFIAMWLVLFALTMLAIIAPRITEKRREEERRQWEAENSPEARSNRTYRLHMLRDKMRDQFR